MSHLLVLALFLVMVGAGFWQLQRHGERRDRNEQITNRSAVEPVPLESVLDPGLVGATLRSDLGESEQYRRVAATGEWRVEDQVLVRNRTLDGAPGFWVLTPLYTADGLGVVINRGWVPRSVDESGLAELVPPPGTVTVVGTVQPSRSAELFQQPDPPDGVLETLARPDVDRLAKQIDYPLVPFLVQLEPIAVDELPVELPLPALDSGPHLSYAVQWFVFATIAAVGYPLILRRAARPSASVPYPEEID